MLAMRRKLEFTERDIRLLQEIRGKLLEDINDKTEQIRIAENEVAKLRLVIRRQHTEKQRLRRGLALLSAVVLAGTVVTLIRRW